MKNIFGTDGIRGKAYEFPIDFETIFKISQAFFEICRPKKLLIANDGRESSKMITEAIFSSIGDKTDIINLGLLTTSAIGYIAYKTNNYAIMISASHNPSSDNGIKIINDLGLKISTEIEEKIENLMETINFENQKNKKINCLQTDKRSNYYFSIYKKMLRSAINENKSRELSTRKIKIAIDFSNGAGVVLEKWLKKEIKKIGNIEVSTYNTKPDGHNINLNCGATDLSFLKSISKKYKFDIGFAIDGDADRLIAIDKNLNILDGDSLLALLAKYYKEVKNVNAPICGTVMSNIGLENFIKKNGMKFERVNVGDKNIQEFIIKNKSFLGAESSGHIIIGNYNITGDSILSILLIILIIKSGYINEEDIFQLFKKFPSILKNYNTKNEIDFNLLQDIQNRIEKKLKPGSRILIRKSGTEKKIRVLVEAEKNNQINEILEQIEKLLTPLL